MGEWYFFIIICFTFQILCKLPFYQNNDMYYVLLTTTYYHNSISLHTAIYHYSSPSLTITSRLYPRPTRSPQNTLCTLQYHNYITSAQHHTITTVETHNLVTTKPLLSLRTTSIHLLCLLVYKFDSRQCRSHHFVSFPDWVGCGVGTL